MGRVIYRLFLPLGIANLGHKLQSYGRCTLKAEPSLLAASL